MFLTFTSLNLVLLWQPLYLFCSSIVIHTPIVTTEHLNRNESGRFGALKFDWTHHFKDMSSMYKACVVKIYTNVVIFYNPWILEKLDLYVYFEIILFLFYQKSHIVGYLRQIRVISKLPNSKPALTTSLSILFQYCYTYSYSDNRHIWTVMKAGGLAL
jgi:hypothetical protein